MSVKVRIRLGNYRDSESRVVEVHNQVFDLLKPYRAGAKGGYVVVDGRNVVPNKPNLRVKVLENEFTLEDEMGEPVVLDETKAEVAPKIEVPVETDEVAMARIRKSFKVLDKMTDAVAEGIVRGLIVSGPPGIGKSYGVEEVIESYEAANRLRGNALPLTEVVKGSMTPIGLYQTLFMNKSPGEILVFDDCDSILFDEVCLNMLKAVLDSGKKRVLSWKSESHALKREGIPDRFEFKGGVIFITNVNFENVRSKKIQDHLKALMSRCHYIDLKMDSKRDLFLRINQIVNDGMLNEYDFGEEGNQEVIDFMVEHQNALREISLRMVLKISDLRKMDPEEWKHLAETTCTAKGT